MANGTCSVRASVWARSVLPEPVGPEQHDVALGQLHVAVLGVRAQADALVVVVHGHGEGALGRPPGPPRARRGSAYSSCGVGRLGQHGRRVAARPPSGAGACAPPAPPRRAWRAKPASGARGLGVRGPRCAGACGTRRPKSRIMASAHTEMPTRRRCRCRSAPISWPPPGAACLPQKAQAMSCGSPRAGELVASIVDHGSLFVSLLAGASRESARRSDARSTRP